MYNIETASKYSEFFGSFFEACCCLWILSRIGILFRKLFWPTVKKHSHIAIVVRPPGRKTLCRSLVICKGFFRPATPAVIWRVFQFCKIWLMVLLFENGFSGQTFLWICHITSGKATCAPAKALQKLSPSRKTTFFH